MADPDKNTAAKTPGETGESLPHRLPEDSTTAEEFIHPFQRKRAGSPKRLPKSSKKPSQRPTKKPASKPAIPFRDVVKQFSRHDLHRALAARGVLDLLERRRKKAHEIRLARARLKSQECALTSELKRVERQIRDLEAEFSALPTEAVREHRRRVRRQALDSLKSQRERDRAVLDRLPPLTSR